MRRRSACLLAALGPAALQAAEPLQVLWMFSSGTQRTLWLRMTERYAALRAGHTVQSREMEQGAYKAEFEAMLRRVPAGADVAFWFGGQRLQEFVAQRLIEPLDDLARADLWEQQFLPAALDAVRVGGRLYGLPLATYQWGFYYRRSLFRRLELQPPTTWDEWLALNDRLRRAGIAPITLGAKDGWPLGAWFDYFNLRLHGKAFHADLLAGRASWLDPRVTEVFARWRTLLERGDVLPGALERDWQQALPYLSRDLAGTVLMGNFVALRFPAAVREDLGFFPFPMLSSKVAPIEEAPLDVLLMPRRGRRKAEAREFLRFMARADVQSELNEAMGMIPPHRFAPLGSDPLVQAGARLLAAAQGSTQFFDRDAPARFSAPALTLLQRFVQAPQEAAALQQELETLRRSVFGVLP